MFAPEGSITLNGMILTAKNVEAVAKSIELSGADETVVQYRRSENNRLFSKSVRETWESHTVALLTEIAAKHVNLVATDGDVVLKGASIQTADGKVNVFAPKGKVILETYKIPHFVKSVEKKSGFSFGGIFGVASVAPHEKLKDVIVNHIPVINAVDNLSKMKSATDLAPVVQFGAEALRILSAGSISEVVTDQLGINMVGGIPLPSGFSLYKTVNEDTTNWMQSIPTMIDITWGEFLSTSDEFAMEGSAIVTKDGKVYINANSFSNLPAFNPFTQRSTTDTSTAGISWSKKSAGVQYGETNGETTTSGHTLSHGGIYTQDLHLNIAGDAETGSPIVSDKIEGNIGGNLLVKTYQEVSDTRSKYNSWSAGITIDVSSGAPVPIPSWSLHFGRGNGERKWAEVPAVIKGNKIYLDVGKECKLVAGGILGQNVTLNAKELNWENIKNIDRYKENSFGFDSGMFNSISGIGGSFSKDLSLSNSLTKAGELAGRAGSIVKGWASFGRSSQRQDGEIRATISAEAEINLSDDSKEKDLSGLNRDEDKMVWVGDKKEQVISIALPLINTKELKQKWENKETLLQQMIEDKNLPEQQRELVDTEYEVTKIIKGEAIDEELAPDDIQEVIDGLTKEGYAAKNLRKLSEYYNDQEISVEEVIDVLEGKLPIKNEKGEIVFIAAPQEFIDYLVKENLAKAYDYHAQDLYEDVENKPEAGLESLCPECWVIDGPVKLLKLGGFALKIIGTTGKEVLKKATAEGIKKGIKPTIEVLKKVSKKFAGSKVKIEVVKDTAKIEKHHAFPKFMGGHLKQDLVKITKSQHVELHKDLLKFLKLKYPEMVTKPGYSGDLMKLKIPPDIRIQALKEFYSGPGAKYTEAAAEFFKQIK